VLDEGLKPYLEDTAEAWILGADGLYQPPKAGAAARSAQRLLLAALAERA